MTDVVQLFQAMADHTRGECAACPRPFSCCDTLYCEMSIKHAREQYGMILEPTGHQTLPLMGKDGCTAAPHFRPVCTVHTCAVASVGCKPNDQKWTDRYFEFRDQIDDICLETWNLNR